MKAKIEIQILSPLTRQQLVALRDDLRSIDGLEAIDLRLPPAQPKQGTMMGGGDPFETIASSLLAGFAHFAADKGFEFIHHKLKAVFSKHKVESNVNNEAMGGKGMEAVISLQSDGEKQVTHLDEHGVETIVNSREYSINPERTHAILIGVSEYEDSANFSAIPPIAGNLNDMHRLLIDKRRMGIPDENIHTSFNQGYVSIIRLLNQISRTPDIETLLVYYAGHGQNTGNNNLHLIAKDSYSIDERLHGAIAYDEIERVLNSSPAAQKIVILDACHSGLAAQSGNANNFDIDPVLGSYILASTSADEVSYYKKDSAHTYFTGYLVKLFNEGVRTVNTMLSLEDIFRYTSEQSQKNNFPMPVRKFKMKNVDESKFFISANPGFDLAALQRKPIELIKQGKQEEAEIEFYRLRTEYPNDTSWIAEYETVKKDKLFNKLVSDADRFFEKGQVDQAKRLYRQALALNNAGFLRLRIEECDALMHKPQHQRPEMPFVPVKTEEPAFIEKMEERKDVVIAPPKDTVGDKTTRKAWLRFIVGIVCLVTIFFGGKVLLFDSSIFRSDSTLDTAGIQLRSTMERDSLMSSYQYTASYALEAGNYAYAIEQLQASQKLEFSSAIKIRIDSIQLKIYYKELSDLARRHDCDSAKLATIKKIVDLSKPEEASELSEILKKCSPYLQR